MKKILSLIIFALGCTVFQVSANLGAKLSHKHKKALSFLRHAKHKHFHARMMKKQIEGLEERHPLHKKVKKHFEKSSKHLKWAQKHKHHVEKHLDNTHKAIKGKDRKLHKHASKIEEESVQVQAMINEVLVQFNKEDMNPLPVYKKA